NWDALYADDSPLWVNLKTRYAAMGEMARARGVDVVVAIIPELSNLDDRYPFRDVHARVGTMCREQGMEVVDLLPALTGQHGPSLWIHPRDRHPNARGHELIASGILGPLSAKILARTNPSRGQAPR